MQVNTEELRKVSTNIKNKKSEMILEYQTNISNYLSDLQAVYARLGLNLEADKEEFRRLFNELNTRVDNLTNTLDNSIGRYNDFGTKVNAEFSNDLSKELDELISIKNKK